MDLVGRVWPAEHAEAVLQASHALCDGTGGLAHWLDLLRQPPLR